MGLEDRGAYYQTKNKKIGPVISSGGFCAIQPGKEKGEIGSASTLNRGVVISNQQPPAGSNVLPKLDLPEFREAQMQEVQQNGNG